MVNLRRKFHRLPCALCNRRPAACAGVGGIQYTYAQRAKRTREGGYRVNLPRCVHRASERRNRFGERCARRSA